MGCCGPKVFWKASVGAQRAARPTPDLWSEMMCQKVLRKDQIKPLRGYEVQVLDWVGGNETNLWRARAGKTALGSWQAFPGTVIQGNRRQQALLERRRGLMLVPNAARCLTLFFVGTDFQLSGTNRRKGETVDEKASLCPPGCSQSRASVRGERADGDGPGNNCVECAGVAAVLLSNFYGRLPEAAPMRWDAISIRYAGTSDCRQGCRGKKHRCRRGRWYIR